MGPKEILFKTRQQGTELRTCCITHWHLKGSEPRGSKQGDAWEKGSGNPMESAWAWDRQSGSVAGWIGVE